MSQEFSPMPELQSRVDLIWIWSSINGFAAIACACGLANTKTVGRLGSPRNMEEAMSLKLCPGGHLLPELGSLGWPCGMWCHCSTSHKDPKLCTEFEGWSQAVNSSKASRTPLKDQLAEVSASLSTRCGRLQWRSGPCTSWTIGNCPRVWQVQDSLWWIRMIMI